MEDFRDEYPCDGGPVIDKRDGGCAVVVGNKVYLWGGQSEDHEQDDEDPIELVIVRDLPRDYDTDHPFDVFNFDTQRWSRQNTTGDIPENGLGSMLEYDRERHMLYLFGGWKKGFFDSELYAISLNDFCWRILPTTECKPSPRYNAATVLHQDRLCVFGGVGPDTELNGRKQDPGAVWVLAPGAANDYYGWNNEYFEYDLCKECWTAPLNEGCVRPPILAGHRFARIDQQRAAMFGGSGHLSGKGSGRLTNALWVIELDERVWQGPMKPSSPEIPWPVPCRFFSFTPIFDPDLVVQSLHGGGTDLKQHLLLLWGKERNAEDTGENLHTATWILQFDGGNPEWTEMLIPVKPRSWHVAVAYHPYPNSTQCEIMVTGGTKYIRGDSGRRMHVSDTFTMQFGVTSLQSLCLTVISKSFPAVQGEAEVDQMLNKLPFTLPHKLRAQLSDQITALSSDVPHVVCTRRSLLN